MIHPVYVNSSPYGCTNDDLGLAWLEQVFDRHTTEKARRSWRLRILDGHGSRIMTDFLEFCYKIKIQLFLFSPHSTHTLQPLDVGCFRQLSHNYSKALVHHLQRTQGLVPVAKGDLFPLFWIAWTQSFIKETILKSFEVTSSGGNNIWKMKAISYTILGILSMSSSTPS